MPQKHIIRLDNVSKSFFTKSREIPVLKGCSVHIYPREFTIIYGPSGSGKSTLLNTITGLEPPTEGKVYVKGKDVFRMSIDERALFRNQHYGIVYQQPYWVKSLNLLDNVALPLLLRKTSTDYARARAKFALSQVGMDKFADKHPLELSGGEQQKSSLARALTADPSLIVADEPTGNLDTKSGNEIIDMLLELIERFSRSVVMVTHELRFLEIADRAISIKDGEVVGSFEKDEIDGVMKELESVGIK